MDKKILTDTFIEMIQDVYHAENQIVKALPLMVEAASYEDLKKAFTKHLKETKEQVVRLEKIFGFLGVSPKEKTCHGIVGLVKEGEEIIGKKELTPAVKDACLIMAAQKVEHYEIATYGSLCAFVKHLSSALRNDVFKNILELLKKTLNEEKKTDIALTELAEGTKLMQGINEEAEKEIVKCCF